MSTARRRAAALPRSWWERLTRLPRGARLAAIGLVVAAGFVGVVLPLFSTGGAPAAEISGLIPETATAGQPVRADIAIDNVGTSIIYPVCVALTGSGVTLVSANFQGLDQVTATGNVACGGQLTGQETISVTLVLRFSTPGTATVTLTPKQQAAVIGPPLAASVAVS